MNSFFILLLSLLSLGDNSEPEIELPVQESLTQYYFIRHAEKDESNKDDRNPNLTPEGVARAAKWAEVFKEVEFDLIFSSNYNRTMQTAKTIADSQKKEVDIYDPRQLNDPVFKEKTKGKTVLVVGHSNTNPAFVNLVLEEKKFQDVDEKEYGSLFIVTVAPNGEKTSQVLYIN
ncbi:SixA phosphatase family protein [Salinimicrobium sp. HB62]|uniref:SixA phosphatase family protein n=1 Tax=Salinimicrobium sp. HB62 TaxID=3077781 RepID=UPI002D785A98|nr:phosphoglycerate mutase family protein [Salinimicrobium sp. HB62]